MTEHKALTFKQILKLLAQAITADDVARAEYQIDISFQAEKITWADHELLYSLAGKINFI